ncbi:glycerate kinase [Lewinella marina]|uniref:Glycerate kinase n=1 Tax=Neolewinella marina TaxID=438751 RepID=A0A2G0CI66_9BACT|nr:glycerate kinase [Neolewinella marina]NJB85196.1 glycerate kinase [Neolewinella marina]PHK99671.1 glycerate kinase [Neolewinella marina]
MNVLVCPDKFKGSLTAEAAARAIARGVRAAWPAARIMVQPLADGGEGSLALLARQPGLKRRRLTVSGPLRRPIEVEYLLGGGRAVIESAKACGLHLVPAPRRHPKHTTTVGVGTLIDDALARGATDVTLLLGGSSTSDCGAGMAAALGYRFISKEGYDFVPMADSLRYVATIDATGKHPGLAQARITALCDVDNPLLGPQGATYTYAPQKGAQAAELPLLESNLAHFADCIQQQLGTDVRHLPGAGAAGGLGAGAVAFLGAILGSGVEGLFRAVDFDRMAREADLVITGEGKVDAQTLHGKVVAGVLRQGRPTVAVCGTSELTAEALGAEALLALDQDSGAPPSECMERAAELLEEMVGRYLRSRNDLPVG